jgi:hypothetical protein
MAFNKERTRIRNELRREYLAGDVDLLHVKHVLESIMLPVESDELAERWQAAKKEQARHGL